MSKSKAGKVMNSREQSVSSVVIVVVVVDDDDDDDVIFPNWTCCHNIFEIFVDLYSTQPSQEKHLIEGRNYQCRQSLFKDQTIEDCEY